jgi:hypothetical protein
MKVAIFVSVWLTGMSSADLKTHFLAEPLNLLKGQAEVSVVEMYTPATGDYERFDEIPPPSLIVEIDMASEKAARALVDSKAFAKQFLDKDAFAKSVEKINLEIMEPVHYPVPGSDTPPPRTAPLSFVVRYYGPVADQAAFVDAYIKSHPPLQIGFPNVRNILCYLPLNWKKTKAITDDSIVIGNEVVFDDLDALKQAFQSKTLDLLFEDSEQFASWGYSTHHAMWRDRVYTRAN